MITSLNYGKPPSKQASPEAIAKRRARAVVEYQNLDRYADDLMMFRDWCEARNINFRHGVVQALSLFQMLNEEPNGEADD